VARVTQGRGARRLGLQLAGDTFLMSLSFVGKCRALGGAVRGAVCYACLRTWEGIVASG